MLAVRFDPLRAAVRASRRLYYRLRGRGIPVVYDARYQRGVYGVPMDPLRGDKVLGALEEAGLLAADLLSEPRPVSLQNLLHVHTPEYLDAVQEPAVLGRILGMEVPARRGRVDARPAAPDGRRHDPGDAPRAAHGRRRRAPRRRVPPRDAGRGPGLLRLQRHRGRHPAPARARLRGPVLVVDLDLHDGNGTRRIFARDETVHTLSIHNEHWGETDAVASTAIALGAGVDDDRYLGTLRETLPPLVAAVRPRARDLRRRHRRRGRRRDRQLADLRRRRCSSATAS